MTPEKRIENKIRKKFEEAGGYINKSFASPNTNKGIPDLIGTINGIYIALEIKRLTGGKPTPVQIKNLQAIANANGLAFVTNDEKIIDCISKKTKKYQNQKINSTKIIINHWSTNQQPTVSQSTKMWQKTKEPHSLQILKFKP